MLHAAVNLYKFMNSVQQLIEHYRVHALHATGCHEPVHDVTSVDATDEVTHQ